MTIEIAYRDPQEIGALTSFYNEQNAGYPYYCPVSSQTLEAGVWYDRRVGKPHRGVHTEKLIVAEEQGEMVGFAHPALFQPDAESPECIGILRHLGSLI